MKYTLVTRKLEKRMAFVRFKIKIWFTDMAYVDKLAKDNNGVKYLLVLLDLFERTVDAKGMRTRCSEKTVLSFFTLITKNNRTVKV